MELLKAYKPLRAFLLTLTSLILAATGATTVLAQESSPLTGGPAAAKPTAPASLAGDFKSAIVIDAGTGLILVANNETIPAGSRPPC